MEQSFTNTKSNFLSGGGEMGERIRNFDWSITPLGNPENWESSLKTCVRIMLSSPQPMFVWWGDKLINIYNDAYRDVLGGKHPAMLGVPGNIVWKEIWEELWARGRYVFEKNEGTFDDALLLIMNRNGYEEETYMKFSYNPIPGTKKITEGLFCVCTEETQRIINERALDTLRKLGAIIFTEKSLDIIYRHIAEVLGCNNKDFPFALIYKITGDSNIVTCAASTGLDKSQHIFPERIDISKPTAFTRDFCQAFRENKMVESEIINQDIPLPTGAWQTPPKHMVYIPVSLAGGRHPYCIIGAALNPYRKFDETYRQFYQLIADRVSIEINKMLALEIEHNRGLLNEIKSIKATEDIPVIFLRARGSEQSLIEGWETGANDYLVKPFSSTELVSSVKDQIKMKKLQQSLQDNLRNLLLEAPAVICVLRGPQHVFEFANERYVEVVGNRDILGKPIREALPEMEGQGIYEILDNVYSTGKPFIGNELPVTLDRGSGKLEKTWFNFVYKPIQNKIGAIDGIFVHGMDVTEQVLARNEIEESEKRLRLITNALPVLISYIDKNRTYRFNNKAYEAWFGQSSTEIYGKHLKDVLGESAYNNLMPKINQVLSGKPVHFEMSVPYKDAGTRWVTADYIPHVGNDNSVYGFYAVINDITAIKNAEELNYQLASIVQTSSDAIISKTLTGIVTSWNAGAERIFGYTAAEMIGESITKIIPEDRLDEESIILSQISQGKNLDQFVTKRITKEGVLVDISITISPVIDSKGKIIGAAKIARDITEDIKARKKIEENEKHLQRTTQHFTLATSAAQVGIWSLDIATQTLEWSDLHKKMWGYTNLDTNLTFEDWHKLIVAEDKEATLATVERTLKTKIFYDVSYRIKRADNDAIRWIQSIGQYFYDDAGEFHTLAGVSIDITEQKKAERALRESEERLRLATQTSSVGIWEWNVVTNIIRWDEQMFRIYGIPPTVDGLVEYSTWRNAIAPEDLAEQEKILRDTVKMGGNSKRSFKIFRANDGMLCDIEAIEAARTNALGETEWVVGTNMDITDRKKSFEKITESEKQFSTLANNIQNLAWIANGEGWIYWYNKRWYDYTGTTLEEMKGWGWQKVHHPEHIDGVVDFVKKAWKVNKPYEITYPLRGADGTYRWFLTRAFPVTDEEGNISSWIGTNTDIEEQKNFADQLEKKVRERTVQLKELNNSLKQKNTSLKNLNKELEAFNYISSHDLQEPLRKILILAGRIIDTEKENLSEKAKHYFDRMSEAAERMRALIQDLLAFSRISSSERKFEMTDLNILVDEIKEEYSEWIEEQSVTITTSDMCEVNIIPFLFRQILRNLISNSLKFSKPDVPLKISIKSTRVKGSKLKNEKLLFKTEYCHISVADNGIGFESQYAEKIFNVFQKLHSKDKYAGTGIGLAIVKKIVDIHQGIISAESEVGKGATFNIYLPLQQKNIIEKI